MNNLPFYSQVLKKGLTQKQALNPKYSLRAYARYLGIHPSILSLAIKGERTLTERDAQLVLSKLLLTQEEETLFRESLKNIPSVIDKVKINRRLQRQVFVLETEHHEPIITDWEYTACLELFDLSEFIVTVQSVAQKLNIGPERAQYVLDTLIEKKLITIDENMNYERIHVNISATSDVPSPVIRQSHHLGLEMAKQKLETVPMELRDYSHITLAIDPTKLEDAKAMIRDFRQKIIAFMSDGNKSEVYRFSFQAYPLTSKDNLSEE